MNETMTAKKLYEIVEPVWKVWPETRPPQLAPMADGELAVAWGCSDPGWAAMWSRVTDRDTPAAIALCEIAMVKALAKHPEMIVEISEMPEHSTAEVGVWHAGSDTTDYFKAPTLIEALAAACLKVKGL